MTGDLIERVLIEFLGWTRIGLFWYTPESLDESDEPGLQSGEPVEVPELCKFLELVKAEANERGLNVLIELKSGTATVTIAHGRDRFGQSTSGTEAEAFARAILSE